MSDVLKKVLIAIAVVWGVVAIGLIVVPRLPASIDYRSVLIDQIEARTGRQAYIDGAVTMQMLPSPEITAENVRIASIDGAPSPDFMRVRRAVFKVDRGSLLSRKVRVTGIELSQPKIYLDVLADGRKSWDFQPVKKPGKTRNVAFDAFKATDATIIYRRGEAQMMLTGDLSYDGAGERPVLDASLKAGKIDLDPFLGQRKSGPDRARDGGKRWSDEPIEIGILRAADGRIDIQADEIRFRRYLLAKPSLAATLSNGRLRIEKASAGLFGGAATATGVVDARDVPALKLEVTLAKASVDKALSDWADTPFASGEFGMTASVSAAGTSQLAMVRSLSGTLKIDAADGVVRGFDAAQLNGELAHLTRYSDFIDLADAALGGGQTRYAKISGMVAIKDGVARFEGVKASLDASRATVTGTVDLPRWTVDMDVALTLTGAQHASTPAVGLSLSGPLDSPDRKNRLGDMGKFVGKRFVDTVIRDVLGDDEPRRDDAAPGERREKTKRVVNRLIDKLEKRKGRERRDPERADRSAPPRQSYRLESRPREQDYPADQPAYEDDPAYPADGGYAEDGYSAEQDDMGRTNEDQYPPEEDYSARRGYPPRYDYPPEPYYGPRYPDERY